MNTHSHESTNRLAQGTAAEPGWVHGHPHDPNPAPPSHDSRFAVRLPGSIERTYAVSDLQKLPQTDVTNCYIVSTGHGTSGPFTFSGVRLLTFLDHVIATGVRWRAVDVISGDGFGTRLTHAELEHDPTDRPSLLALTLDRQPLTREQGLVRLIVPTETDDALKQVKWVAEIVVKM